MKSALVSFLQAACFAALLIHAPVTKAQGTPPDADPYSEVKDKTLHDALAKLRYVNAGLMELMGTYLYSPAYMKQGLDLAEYFSDPEAPKALSIMLD